LESRQSNLAHIARRPRRRSVGTRIPTPSVIPFLVPLAAGGEEPENGPRAPQVAPESPTRAIDAAFEQWLFGAESPHAVEAARRRVTFDLRERIAALDAVCRLTDEQRSRLALAREGDIRKLFDRTDRLRVRFRHDFRDGQKPDPQSLTENTLREWAAIREDPFESGSLFHQTRQRLLTDDQKAAARAASDRTPTRQRPDDPRQISIKTTMVMIHLRPLRDHSVDLDKLFGRTGRTDGADMPERSLSIVPHDVLNSPEFATLCEQKVAKVLSQPTLRTHPRGEASWTTSAPTPHPGRSLGSYLHLNVAPKNVSPAEMRLDITLESGRNTNIPLFDAKVAYRSIGTIRYAASVKAGEHIVLSRIVFPGFDDESEFVVLLSPELDPMSN
jgi:hypothetical protein